MSKSQRVQNDKQRTQQPQRKQQPTRETAPMPEPQQLLAAAANPLQAGATALLGLQRTIGNRAVQRLLSAATAPEPVQRASQAASLEGGALEGGLQSEIEHARGGGAPLDAAAGAGIGRALGTDFSGVKVHTDLQSDALNRTLNAKAFTLGSDIFFSKGAYNPGSHGGNKLLAHELTHVVQQVGAKANRVQAKLVVGPAGDQYEQEADQIAERVSRSMSSTAAPADAEQPTGGPEEQAQATAGPRALRRAIAAKPVATAKFAPAGTIQRNYDALNSMGKSRIDALAEKKYAQKTQEFEFKMAPKIMNTPENHVVVDSMLMTLKKIVDAWAKATGKSQGQAYGREFGFAVADKYYGAFEMTGANIQKVFDEAATQPMRAKLKVIYNATRNNNISKYLKLAALEMDRSARAKAPKSTHIRTSTGGVKNRAGEFVKSSTEKETVSSGFAGDSGLDKILSGDRVKEIKSEAKKEKVKTGWFRKKHVFGADKFASIFNWKDKLRQDSGARAGNQSAGLGLSEQETLNFRDVPDMTDEEASLLYKRQHGKAPSDIELTQFKQDPSAKVMWEQGREFYSVIPDSDVAKEAAQFRARLEAGISGSTDLMLNAAIQLGMNSEDEKKRLRLSLAGWMLANRDHSFYEVYKSAENFGLPFEIDKAKIGSEYESDKNLYPMEAKDFKDLLPEKEFPSYFLSKTYKAQLATGLTGADKDAGHFKAILKAEGVADDILLAVDERGLSEMMQLSGEIKDAGFNIDSSAPKKKQALRRVQAGASYGYLARAYPALIQRILLALLHTHHGAMGLGSNIGDAKDKLLDAGVPRNWLDGLNPKQLNDLEALRVIIQGGTFDKKKNKWSNQAQADTAFKKLKGLGTHAEMARAAMMRTYHGSEGLSETQKMLAGVANSLVGSEQSGSQKMSDTQLSELAVPSHVTGDEEKRKFWSVNEAKGQLGAASEKYVLQGLAKVKKVDQGPVVEMIKTKLKDNVTELNNFKDVLSDAGFADAVKYVLDMNLIMMSDVSVLIPVDLPPEIQALSNLNDIEKGAIFQYTTDMFKPIVSTSQGLGMKSHTEAGQYTLKHTAPWLQAIASGLKKLPPYPNPVYRVQSSGSKPPLHEQGDTEKQKFVNKYYPVGRSVPFNYPTSTAKSTNSEYLGKEGLNMDMMFKYDKHKSGKDIQAISHKFKEEEVLFPAGTRFKVTGHAPEEGLYKKKVWIHLEEA